MAVGDVVEYKGRYWKVLSEDKGIRTFTLQNWEGLQEEVAANDAALGKMTKVSTWPFLISPAVSSKARRLTSLTRTVRGQPVELVPFHEWSPASRLQLGGPIFFNPTLNLIQGEVLVLNYDGGSSSRLVINPQFGTISVRKKRTVKTEAPPKTLYDFLDDD